MAAGKTTRTRSVEGDADKEMRCQGNVISELKVENLLYIEHLARPNRHISHYARTKLSRYRSTSHISELTPNSTRAFPRAYNNLFQLTQLTVGSAINRTYAFPAPGLNNGKLVSQTDALSGETVVYTYDMLNRLSSAQTNAGSPTWGQSYTYDGFGNLTDQNVIAGSAPSMHVTYNAASNRQTAPVADTADANGNILGSPYSYLQNAFDIDNRLVQPGNNATIVYSYDAGNKRIWRGDSSAGLDELDFFAGNQKLATYQISSDSGAIYFTLKTTNVYFGGKLVSKGARGQWSWQEGADHVVLSPIAADRLGSIGKFYPYGQERPSATTNDTEKFTGYFRDAAMGLDYADQRYHQPGQGRFLTPDPFGGSARTSDPGSWNRYAYVGGDPINNIDPTGQWWVEAANGSWLIGNPGASDWGNFGCGYICGYLAQAYAIINYYQTLGQRYSTEIAQLQDLQGQGFINSYGSVDFLTGTVSDLNVNWDGVFDLLEKTPQVISTWEALITALRTNPVLAVLGLFLMQNGDGHPGRYRSPKDMEANCTPVGQPVSVPSTNTRNKGGTSWEQEYDCGADGHWTIQRLYDKDGKLIDEHSRPGGPKYGSN